jgi:hypothetical protein
MKPVQWVLCALLGALLVGSVAIAQERFSTITGTVATTLPKGRSFESLVAALPSVSTGQLEGGIQVNGASAGRTFIFVNRNSNSSRMNLAAVDLTPGYDCSALLAQTPDAAKPARQNASGYADPRYPMADQWNPGFRARFSVRVLF